MRCRINPCGLVWTYLRSCYSFTMRLYIGGVETHVPARWYFCAPGAQQFPFSHGCEASPWLKNYERNDAWGEITPYPTDPDSDVFRGLDRGVNPGYPGRPVSRAAAAPALPALLPLSPPFVPGYGDSPLPCPSTCGGGYIGDPQWFVDGMLPADILSTPPPASPCSCQCGTTQGSGGMVIGGSGQVPVPCGSCRGSGGMAPALLRITLSGGTGDFGPLNGPQTLPYEGGCSWFTVIAGIPVVAGAGTSGMWGVTIGQYPTRYALYAGPIPGLDCYAPSGPLVLVGTSGYSGTPPSVALN